MSEEIKINPNCRKCGEKLTIDELHYFDHGDGTATCNECEGKWSNDCVIYRLGLIDELPERP